jgi:hypothetical protein
MKNELTEARRHADNALKRFISKPGMIQLMSKFCFNFFAKASLVPQPILATEKTCQMRLIVTHYWYIQRIPTPGSEIAFDNFKEK